MGRKQIKNICGNLLTGKSLTESIILSESVADESKARALLQFLKIDPTPENLERVSVESYDANRLYIDNERNEFLVCTDEEADEEFKDSFMNLIDDLGLESFASYARDYILENFCDEDVINDYYRDDVKSYAEDISQDSNSPETYTVEDESGDEVEVEVTNRLFQECMENDLLDLDDFKASDFEDGEYVGDKDLVEIYCDHFDSPEVQGYDSGYDWLSFNFGKDFANKFLSDQNAIDWDAASEWVKDEDGRGNKLSSWDGTEYEETVDGETYYIYPACDPDSV